MSGDWYPNPIKVFYVNPGVENIIIYSRVKGVTIKLDEGIQSTIFGFKPNGHKSHLSVPGVNKLGIYKACLRNLDEPKNYPLFKVEELRRDDML